MMKYYLIPLILVLAACANRTKALNKLVGTPMDEVLTKWDKPKKVIELTNDEKAYAFVYAYVRSNGVERSAGNEGIKPFSIVSYTYTVIRADIDGTILSWDVKQLDDQIDSSTLVTLFELNAK